MNFWGWLCRLGDEPAKVSSPEPISLPTPKNLELFPEIQELGEYEEAARQRGFYPAELMRLQLIKFFASRQIPIYDYGQCTEWLTAMRMQAGAYCWYWRPLRERDVIKEFGWYSDSVITVPKEDDCYSDQFWECRPFDSLVPQVVLARVAEIEEKFGADAKFLVSYFEGAKSFAIMVRPKMCDSGELGDYEFIFHVWKQLGIGF